MAWHKLVTATPPDGVMRGMRAFNVQSYIETNVKLGLQFTVTIEAEIASGASAYYAIKTPASPYVSIKQRTISTNGGMRYTPRVGATFTTTEPLESIVNLNGNSANVSLVEIREVLPVNVTNEGVAFDVVRSATGAGNISEQGIFLGDGIERILRTDSEYLLKFENLDNNTIYVIFGVTWYEGGLDLEPLHPVV